MRRTGWSLVLVLLWAAPAPAQHAQPRFADADTSAKHAARWTTLRVAKWSTLTAATGAFVYGFVQNRSADRDYADIERLCQASASSCERVSSSGPYQDATLEARYQSVLSRDRRARSALLAGQLGIAASVVLFILDLPASAAPPDIPYEPHRLDLGLQDGQLRLGGRLRFR